MSVFAATVNELSSGKYKGTLKDDDGVVVPLSKIASATLTLYNEADDSIINSRTAQDVLNKNGVTIDVTTGLLTWAMQPADNPILDDTKPKEAHRALFVIGLNGGGQITHEARIIVVNLALLP